MKSTKSMSGEAIAVPSSIGKFSAPIVMEPSERLGTFESVHSGNEVHRVGLLIVNADDWGRDRDTTDQTLECIDRGAVCSVSAMMFMKDSERGAEFALDRGVDTGLHLNFTTAFSAPGTPTRLIQHQERISRYLGQHRLAQVVFHPWLVSSFEYVAAMQRDEFYRLYGTEPARLDGHHHMHLCSNVLLGGLLPPGTVVRRNFSFQPGERNLVNRLYRKAVDCRLARRHRLVDFFFSLPPLALPGRLERILSLARHSIVEVATHPVRPEEHRFLMGEEFLRMTAGVRPPFIPAAERPSIS